MKQKLQRLLRPAGIILGALVIVGLLAFSARSTNTTPVKELAVEVDLSLIHISEPTRPY